MNIRTKIPVITLAVFLLFGCKRGPDIPTLPTVEVLQNAAKASQSLESASYAMTIEYQTTVGPLSIGGNASIDGVLQSAGEQVQFTLSTKSSGKNDGEPFSVKATIDVLVESAKEVYVKISSFESDPNDMFIKPDIAQRVKDQWWLVPSDSQQNQPSVTPDPRLLHMQAQVVKVTKDNGLLQVGDRYVYNYDVEIEKQKLLAYIQATSPNPEQDIEQLASIIDTTELKGTLWIDSETFYIHRIQWFISKTGNDVGYGTFSLSVDARFSDHNTAPQVSPPVESLPFYPGLFIGQDYSGSIPTSSDTMKEVPVEAQEQIIQDLLDDSHVFPNNPPL